MNLQAYEPDRARQLRILLCVVLAAAATMGAVAAFLLFVPGRVVDTRQILLVLVLPAAVLAGLGGATLWLLAAEQPAARLTSPVTAVLAVGVGLVLSRSGPGFLVAVVGIMLLLISVLPGREPDA